MKIYREIIDGIDTAMINYDEVGSMFLYKASETPLNGYTDVTSITNWHKFGNLTKRDYRFVRERMRELADDKTDGYTNMAALSNQELIALSQRLLLDPQECMNVLGMAEFEFYKRDWVSKSKACRYNRWEEAKSAVLFNYIGLDDAKQIVVELDTLSLISMYYSGIEGIDQDGIEGIFDYILATDGSTFENTGLAKSTIQTAKPIAEICDDIIGILLDGNYEIIESRN
jgi:hypothetical protein